MKLIPILTLFFLSTTAICQEQLEGFWGKSPSGIADTLYFPFEDNVQLIVVNYFDAWSANVAYHEMTQPRGASWAQILGPSLPNAYIFRDSNGLVVASYNTLTDFSNSLKGVDYCNTTELSLSSIVDYQQFNGHLMYYETPFSFVSEPFSNKRLPYSRVGLIDISGEVIVTAIYDGIRPFQRSDDASAKYIISRDTCFGFLDSNFNVLFPPIYKSYHSSRPMLYSTPEHEMPNGKHLKVFKNDRCGLIDQRGKILIDFKYDDIYPGHDSTYLAVIKKKDGARHKYFWHYVENCVVHNSDFTVLSVIEGYDRMENYGYKKFRVMKDGKYGLIDNMNKIIIPVKYRGIDYANGGYGVFADSSSGIVSREGEVLLPLIFDSFVSSGNVIYVTKNGLIGLYNKDYIEVIPPRFVSKYWDDGLYRLTDADGKMGYVKHSKEDTFYMSPEGVKISF